jgi:nitroimidazol reductase NimA-like FMN-containing flavoprotein (pyridoxamine 5'-phosphate oxidase superfamily)
MSAAPPPSFRTLERAEADAILLRNTVGRLVYPRRNAMEVEPVHYVFAEGWLWGRGTFGHRWETPGESSFRWWPVTFAVDEVEDPTRWRSVTVRGGLQPVEHPEEGGDPAVWSRASELARRSFPASVGYAGALPLRGTLFRVSVQEAVGRAAPATEAGSAR